MEFTHKTHTYITEAVIAYSLLYIPIECMSFRGIPNAENGINKHYGGYTICFMYHLKEATERKF